MQVLFSLDVVLLALILGLAILTTGRNIPNLGIHDAEVSVSHLAAVVLFPFLVVALAACLVLTIIGLGITNGLPLLTSVFHN